MEVECKRCCSKNLRFEKMFDKKFEQTRFVCMDCGYEF